MRNYCLNHTEQEDHRVAQRKISGTKNQIDPFGQQVRTSKSDQPVWTTSRTSKSDRPIQTTRSLQIAWTVIEPLIAVAFFKVPEDLTVIEPLITVTLFKFPKDWTVIEPLIAVTFFEVTEDRTVIGPLYTVPFLEVQKRSSHRTIPDHTSD